MNYKQQSLTYNPFSLHIKLKKKWNLELAILMKICLNQENLFLWEHYWSMKHKPPSYFVVHVSKVAWDCFHTRAKCVIWTIIWIAHFELRCVHTREVIVIFELCSVHTRDRIWDFAFQRKKNVWVPCQSNMHGARISCASIHMQRAVYRRNWLEGHLAPPPQSRFRDQGIHTVISLHDLRDA